MSGAKTGWRANTDADIDVSASLSERDSPVYSMRLSLVDDVQALESAWLELQERSDCSFFQSWGWIGSWLETLPEHRRLYLLQVLHDRRTVGAALLGYRTARRHKLIVSRMLMLSQTGIAQQDALTVEHNGMLLERGMENEILRCCLPWLAGHVMPWDELAVAGLEQDDGQRYLNAAAQADVRASVTLRKPYYLVDLAALRESGREFLATLSRNTRHQIRRSIRSYEEAGELALRAATSIEEVMQFFDALRTLHQKYWEDKGWPGAFAGRFANSFHESLIARRFPLGEVQLLEVSAGGEPFGYLYNFVFRGKVYNYQSGFVYGDNAHLKPGMVSHYKAIQYNLQQGLTAYDFLMGDHRYKRSLATTEREMLWLILQKRRWRFVVEDRARTLRDWARTQFRKDSA
ncbi:MAG: GNAT family N-acetyltransferase [Gammaproteobacteria bacterium]